MPATGFPAPYIRHGNIPLGAGRTPTGHHCNAGDAQERRHRNRFTETGLFARIGAILGVLDSVAFQVVYGILDGAKSPGLVVGNLQLLVVSGELFFEGHD